MKNNLTLLNVDIVMMNKKSHIVPLLPSAQQQMADKIMEDIEVDSSSETGAELDSAARKASKQLQDAMKFVYIVYDTTFQRLLEALPQCNRYMNKTVHAMIGALPIITRSFAQLPNLDHEQLIL